MEDSHIKRAKSTFSAWIPSRRAEFERLYRTRKYELCHTPNFQGPIIAEALRLAECELGIRVSKAQLLIKDAMDAGWKPVDPPSVQSAFESMFAVSHEDENPYSDLSAQVTSAFSDVGLHDPDTLDLNRKAFAKAQVRLSEQAVNELMTYAYTKYRCPIEPRMTKEFSQHVLQLICDLDDREASIDISSGDIANFLWIPSDEKNLGIIGRILSDLVDCKAIEGRVIRPISSRYPIARITSVTTIARSILSNTLSKIQHQQQYILGDYIMGDSYSAGQAGAQGPGAQASHMTFNQVWNQVAPNTNFTLLATELSTLKNVLQERAIDPEHEVNISAVSAAQKYAMQENGEKVVECLRSAGSWAFEVAKSIGIEMTVSVIKAALGINA